MSFDFDGKKVLVAGGTSMIGIPLVEMLVEKGASVRIASLDDPSRAHPSAEFFQLDMQIRENCEKVCDGIDYVFNLLGVKGSPAVTTKKPANFFEPVLLFNTHLMGAAFRAGAEGFLFTSSIAVYSPAEVLREDDVWKTAPSDNDKFAGWAKRMGELQGEAYRIQYGWNSVSVVRPGNTYGPFDNFDLENAMVVPSLIKRAVDGEDPMRVWGNGTARRDFVHARDVARGMILVAEQQIVEPVNLASGQGVSIRELVEIILSHLDVKPKVLWQVAQPTGDFSRVMDISRARSYGYEPKIPLQDGIREVMDWYRRNKEIAGKRYDIFSKGLG